MNYFQSYLFLIMSNGVSLVKELIYKSFPNRLFKDWWRSFNCHEYMKYILVHFIIDDACTVFENKLLNTRLKL